MNIIYRFFTNKDNSGANNAIRRSYNCPLDIACLEDLFQFQIYTRKKKQVIMLVGGILWQFKSNS